MGLLDRRSFTDSKTIAPDSWQVVAPHVIRAGRWSRPARIQNAIVFRQGTHQASLGRDDTFPDTRPKDDVGSFVAVQHSVARRALHRSAGARPHCGKAIPGSEPTSNFISSNVLSSKCS
jgi:hypothetical protein